MIVAGLDGQTTLAMNMAEYAAVAGTASVAIFSMEMPAEQVITACSPRSRACRSA